MNKKSMLGLILFACLVISTLFLGASLMINQSNNVGTGVDKSYTKDDIKDANTVSVESVEESSLESSEESTLGITDDTNIESLNIPNQDAEGKVGSGAIPSENSADLASTEPWLSTNPSDTGTATTKSTFNTAAEVVELPQLIYDSNDVDYKAYIPKMRMDNELQAALNIKNPSISLDAEAAILFDAETKKVLYHKNAVEAMFPASTVKLLTSLVALKYCDQEEQVKIGDEITMIASDSTRAYLRKGQVLTLRNLLEGMLLPSGNDAAYAVAVYVGRKSLENPKASKEEAVYEFLRLMNEEAKRIGVKNSSFKTPDGYDAIGQYTTAYDMGMIGIAASNNSIITEISQKSSSRNIFVSGQDVTWSNTNKLITRYSGQYYSHALGLKTGTSSLAGRCLISAAERDGKKVVCVILNSTSSGRWEDSISLLKYGLN